MIRRMRCQALPILLAAAGLFAAGGTVSAQPRSPRSVEWGLSLGFNSTSMDLLGERAIFDFYGGLRLEVRMADRLALGSGLVYTRKGGDGSLPSWGMLTVVTPVSVRVQYLELPLILKFSPSRGLYLEAGVYGAVKVGGSMTVLLGGDGGDLINGTDAGYVLGIGGEMRLFGRRQYTGFRYSHGLTGVLSTGDYRHSTFTYLIGVYF